jgi:hypothetical protein
MVFGEIFIRSPASRGVRISAALATVRQLAPQRPMILALQVVDRHVVGLRYADGLAGAARLGGRFLGGAVWRPAEDERRRRGAVIAENLVDVSSV